MKTHTTNITGCVQVDLSSFRDGRGSFTKTYHFSSFDKLGLEFECKEEYVSTSNQNVVRGMHFQSPPNDHNKIVYCLAGKVRDVILDIRKDSKTFGQCLAIELDADNPSAIYIPRGCAHGFLVISDAATMLYRVSTEHSPASDLGIRWNSFGFNWEIENPIISERDNLFPSFENFVSPF